MGFLAPQRLQLAACQAKQFLRRLEGFGQNKTYRRQRDEDEAKKEAEKREAKPKDAANE